MRPESDKLAGKRMDPLVMRCLNAIELLKLLRQNGRISRSMLATLSRLSKPTVSDQIDSLIHSGLVVEVGPGSASARGGKRPTLLEFNSDFGRVLCVDIGPEVIRFASADLMGRILRRFELPTQPEQGPTSVLQAVKRGVASLLKGDSTHRKLQLISVAAPGIVDVRNGIVLETDNVFGWRKLDVGGALRSAFGINVHIDNDVNMAALAELHAGGDNAPRDFVLVRSSTGIGAGVVLGGMLHHGAHWAAGEIGHMVLNAGSAAGPAIPRGYLESIVGADRVKQRARKAARGTEPQVSSLIRREGAWAALAAAALDPANPLADTLSDITLHFACSVANIAAMYDPEVIILLGEPFPLLLKTIQDVARKLIAWPIEIRLSALGDDASLQGAVAAGVARAYGQIAGSFDAEGWADGARDHRNRTAMTATTGTQS